MEGNMSERQPKVRISRRALLLGAAGSTLGATAAGWVGTPGAGAQGARRGGTLRVALESDPPNMDPHRSTAAVDRQVFQNLYDKLVDTDEKLNVVPMLATSWSISADAKVYTFRLRSGVTFHDGTPFNAEAVKYNFERMRDPNFPSARRSEIGPIKDVVVVDPLTVRIVLDRPYSPLLYVLTDRAGMMVSPAAARREGVNFALRPVGTGPFRFVEKIPQDHITLERNPNYWVKGQPHLDRIVYRPIVDDNARVASLKSGDTDIISVVPLPQIRQLKKEAAQPGARFQLIERGPFAWNGIWLNVTKPHFDNKLLRQACKARPTPPTPSSPTGPPRTTPPGRSLRETSPSPRRSSRQPGIPGAFPSPSSACRGSSFNRSPRRCRRWPRRRVSRSRSSSSSSARCFTCSAAWSTRPGTWGGAGVRTPTSTSIPS